MNPKIAEYWKTALAEFHKAEKMLSGEQETNADIIGQLMKAVIFASLAIREINASEGHVAIGDILELGEEIKNKPPTEALKRTKKALKRIWNLAPQEKYNLPEP